jgi:hypothetical protein
VEATYLVYVDEVQTVTYRVKAADAEAARSKVMQGEVEPYETSELSVSGDTRVEELPKRYILVESGERVRFDDDGEPDTSGALGVIEEGNVYLTAYGKHLSGPKVAELEVGQRALVEYNLSGSKGTYEVLRLS